MKTAAVTLVDIGTLDGTAGELLGGIDDGGERVAVVWIARERLGVQHELAAWGASVGADDRGLDAELIGRAGLALADALDLGSVE
jgi:YD repeat-containing protein